MREAILAARKDLRISRGVSAALMLFPIAMVIGAGAEAASAALFFCPFFWLLIIFQIDPVESPFTRALPLRLRALVSGRYLAALAVFLATLAVACAAAAASASAPEINQLAIVALVALLWLALSLCLYFRFEMKIAAIASIGALTAVAIASAAAAFAFKGKMPDSTRDALLREAPPSLALVAALCLAASYVASVRSIERRGR
jgi:hypothetical protein